MKCVAKMFNSICLLFISLNLSLNALINFVHSLAYSSVVEGFCHARVGKRTVLFSSSHTFRCYNLASNCLTFESRELRDWFGPGSLILNSDRYLVMSTISSKFSQPLSIIEFSDSFGLHIYELS